MQLTTGLDALQENLREEQEMLRQVIAAGFALGMEEAETETSVD